MNTQLQRSERRTKLRPLARRRPPTSLVAFLLLLCTLFHSAHAANNYDDAYAADDAAAANDDAVANDDAAVADDFYAAEDDDATEEADDGNAAAAVDDDVFHWDQNVGFDGVSVMPLSCIN